MCGAFSKQKERESSVARVEWLREKELPVRIRLLDEQLSSRYNLPLTDVSVPVSQFSTLHSRW